MIRRIQALMDRGASFRLENEDGLRCVWIWGSLLEGPDALVQGKRETLDEALADALDQFEALIAQRRKS